MALDMTARNLQILIEGNAGILFIGFFVDLSSNWWFFRGFFVEMVVFSSKWWFCSSMFRGSGGVFVDFSSKWWFFRGFSSKWWFFRCLLIEIVVFVLNFSLFGGHFGE